MKESFYFRTSLFLEGLFHPLESVFVSKPEITMGKGLKTSTVKQHAAIPEFRTCKMKKSLFFVEKRLFFRNKL